MRYEELTIEGRNAVLEAFAPENPLTSSLCWMGVRMGRCAPLSGRPENTIPSLPLCPKSRLDQMSETGKHQGVIAYAAAYEYAQVEDILKLARDKGSLRLLLYWTT